MIKAFHTRYGKGKVVEEAELFYKIDFGKSGVIEISKRSQDLELTEEEENKIDMEELETTLRKILDQYSDISQVVEMGDKWEGGKMILHPANPSLKSKEIPIETFFHKIVMMRDRLRVLEQNINSNTKLTDEEKINLQQYITRCYGSMTTFNVLFRNDEDFFTGEKK